MSSSKNQLDQDTYIPLKLILPITSIGIFMSAMDSSIVNVSLKTIAEELDTFFTGFQRTFDPERNTAGKEFESAYYLAIGFTFLLFAFLNSLGIIFSWKRGEERLNIS